MFAYSANAEQEPISVSVDATHILSTISPYIVNGFNFNNSMQVLTIKGLVEKLGITNITFPAGEAGDQAAYKDDDLKFFKQQQEYLGKPFTFMQVRLYGGTKDEAVNLVKRVKEFGIRVDAWTIGNEADLYLLKKGDDTWNPKKYNQIFREWTQAMKAVDPKIIVAGPGASQPYDNWIAPFIADCGDIVDVLMWHWYPTDGKASDENAIHTASQAKTMIDKYRTMLTDPEKNPKGYKRHIQMAVNEWAISWASDRMRHLTDMVGAIWNAEVIGIFAEENLDYSNYFCLNQFGAHALFNKLNKPLIQYHLFAMYAEYFGKQLIESTSPDAALKVTATLRQDKDISVFLINEDPAANKTVTVNFKNIPGIKGYTAVELNQDVRRQPVASELVKVEGKNLTIALSPFSVTVVRITPVTQ